jgi:hypothetical protein
VGKKILLGPVFSVLADAGSLKGSPDRALSNPLERSVR